MKNYKNYISLAILLIVMCGIIVAFTQVSKSNSLSTTPPTNNSANSEEEETKKFEFIDSKQSLNTNIDFENNFGGSGKEEIFEIYNFNDYYIIGTSTSNDMYFENSTQNSIYVLICDNCGNAKSVNLFEIEKTCKILSCKIFRNKIYILIQLNGTKLLSFDLGTNKFDIEFFDENTNSELIISNEPIVVLKSLDKTKTYNVLSKTEKLYPIAISNIVMGCEYLNGTLLICNSNTNILIGILTSNSFNKLAEFENMTLKSFNITNSNFVMIATSNQQTQLMILDLNFTLISTTIISNCTNYNLFTYKNQHYLTAICNNTLKLYSFCEHGTITNELNIFDNVNNYKILFNNNIFTFLINTNDNFLNLCTFNTIGEQKNSIQILTDSSTNINAFEYIDSTSFMIIGTYAFSNQLISSTFGDKDIFVCKLTLNKLD